MVAEVDVSPETGEKLTEVRDAVESATGKSPSDSEVRRATTRRALNCRDIEELVEE